MYTITGKTARKKVKRKIIKNNFQEKSYHGKCKKYYKTKENSLIDALSPNGDNNLHDICENNKMEKCHKILLNKKIEGKIKMDVAKAHADPIIKKFSESTNSVKKRCELYSENLKELLSKKYIPTFDLKRNINTNANSNANDVVPIKRVKYTAVNWDPEVTIEQSNDVLCPSVMPLARVKKAHLRSYDLVKTILNSQKDYSSYNDPVLHQNRTNNSIRSEQHYKSSHNFIRDAHCEFNAASSLNKLKFDSHSHQKHSNYVSKETKFFNVSFHNIITQSVNKEKIYDTNLRKHFIDKSKEEKKKQNVDNVGIRKLDKAIQCNGYQETYKISFSNINSTNKIFEGIHNKLHHDGRNYNVTGNIQSTYTIVDSNVSFNIQSYINRENQLMHQKSIILNEKCNYNISDQHHDSHNRSSELFSGEFNNKSNSKAMFSPYSENIESQIISNSMFEPLNVCEAVYENDDTSRQVVTKGLDENGGDNKEIRLNTNTKLRIKNKPECDKLELINRIDDVSHHFQNLNLRSDVSKINNKKDEQGAQGTELNLKNPNIKEMYTFESLGIYLETIPDLMEIIDRNQSCNDFEIQNRHNFVPKGNIYKFFIIS